MFREMRRKDRKLSTDKTKELLKNSEYGVLSTMADNDYPYGVPVHYVFIEDSIYIHCAAEGQKLDGIRKNPKVSFCVIGSTEVLPQEFSAKYESVIAFGKATELQGEEKKAALVLILEKYAKEYMSEGKREITKVGNAVSIIQISIEHMTGKARK